LGRYPPWSIWGRGRTVQSPHKTFFLGGRGQPAWPGAFGGGGVYVGGWVGGWGFTTHRAGAAAACASGRRCATRGGDTHTCYRLLHLCSGRQQGGERPLAPARLRKQVRARQRRRGRDPRQHGPGSGGGGSPPQNRWGRAVSAETPIIDQGGCRPNFLSPELAVHGLAATGKQQCIDCSQTCWLACYLPRTLTIQHIWREDTGCSHVNEAA
jgi:hypothetical protein